MDVATTGDHWSRCRHHLQLQLPLPLSLIHFSSSHSEWICNDRAGFWTRDGGRQVSRPQRGVRVITMRDAGLDTKWRVEVPPGAAVLRLLVPSVAVGVFIDCRCVADGVEVTRWLISATRELFSEDERVEFWPWIVEGTELPPWQESLSPTGTETRLLAGGSWEFHEGPRFCWFWWLARLQTFHTTAVGSGWGLWECIVQYRCSTLR